MADKTAKDNPELDEFADVDLSIAAGEDRAKEKADESGGGLRSRFPEYISSLLDASPEGVAKGHDTIIVRWLLEPHEWLTFANHSRVPTKPKPASEDADRKWPAKMGAICRADEALASRTGGKCYICDNIEDPYKPGKKFPNPPRTWTIGVLRQEIVEDGSVVGYTDAMKEVAALDENGEPIENETELIPRYIVVNNAYGNFFSPLRGYFRQYKTLLDRDYVVQREGTGTDTKYHFVPLDPTTVVIPDENGNDQEVKLDLRDGDLMETLYGDRPDFRKLVLRNASMEHYNRWFIPQPEDGQGSSGGDGKRQGPASSAQSKEATKERLQRLRERAKAAPKA